MSPDQIVNIVIRRIERNDPRFFCAGCHRPLRTKGSTRRMYGLVFVRLWCIHCHHDPVFHLLETFDEYVTSTSLVGII